MNFKAILNDRSDFIGIVSATICLIHCIVVPIFFAYYVHDHNQAFRAFGPEFQPTHTHYHFGSFGFFKVDYIFLTIGFIAIWFSSKHTENKWIRFFMWVSYFVLVGSVVMEEAALFFQVTLYIASIGLIFAHLVNLRHLRLHFRAEPHTH